MSLDSAALQTPVKVPVLTNPVTYSRGVVFIGSCFAEHLGLWLQHLHFRVTLNPSGILYNPVSVAACLDRLMSGRLYTADELFQQHGLWMSSDHHGSFSDTSQAHCLERINQSFTAARAQLQTASHLFLTLGSALVFKDIQTGRVVANCHRRPAACFSQHMLTPAETAQTLRETAQRLRTFNPELEIVFTVSPVRHGREDLHRNMVSKAVLLTAVSELTDRFRSPSAPLAGCSYFPAFEIFLDELRDYRFYAADMLHPSETAIALIRKRFADACFSRETRETAAQVEALLTAAAHRPLHPDSMEYQTFRQQTLQKIADFCAHHPYIDLHDEAALLE